MLILVGGEGKRLSKISKGIPKPLVEINGVPFLTYLIRYLSSFGLKRIILCAGYRSEYIKEYIAAHTDGDFSICISDERQALGTAGAIKNAEGLIQSQSFLVINGDTFLEMNYKDFIDSFYNNRAIASIALTRVDNSKAFGSVAIDSNCRIIDYKEKQEISGHGNLVSAGVYMFRREVLNSMPQDTYLSLEYNVMPLLLEKFDSRVYGYYCSSVFIDIGTPEKFKRAGQILRRFS